MTKQRIPSTSEAWEDGTLGRDEKFVKVDENPDELEALIDEGLKLKLISIRLKESLISDLKLIAEREGLGYQPLMKQVLERFVDSELKMYARKRMREAQVGNSDDDQSRSAACG